MENNKQPTINAEEMEAAQNFEMFYVPSKIPNKKQKRLIIYTSPEKTSFFEFYHNPDDDTFYCKDCINVRPCVAVRLVEDPENPRKKKIKFVSKQEEQKEETVEEGTRRSTRKRVRNPVVADDDDSAENAPIQKKKRDSIEVVDAENYEEVQIVRRNGHVIHRLLIYTSPERTARYEFNYNRFAESYHCRICLSMNSVVSVKLFKDGADEKMKFRLGINDHICEPFQAEDFNDEGMVSGSLLEVKAEPTESSEGVAGALKEKKPRKKYERKQKPLDVETRVIDEDGNEVVTDQKKPPKKKHPGQKKIDGMDVVVVNEDGTEVDLEEEEQKQQPPKKMKYQRRKKTPEKETGIEAALFDWKSWNENDGNEIEWIAYEAMEPEHYQRYSTTVMENLKLACADILR